MATVSNSNIAYKILCSASIVALGIVVLCTDKGELHLWLAGHHAPWADHFFRYFTYIGAYSVYVVAAIWLLLRYWHEALLLLGTELCSGVVVQIIKHIVHAPRPLTWFAEHMPEVSLPLVEGQQMAYWNSFPSGHTASCFVLCFFLSRCIKNPAWQAGCILLAWIGAYSRIYLQMHFTDDVVVGAAIGTAFAWIYSTIIPFNASWRAGNFSSNLTGRPLEPRKQ